MAAGYSATKNGDKQRGPFEGLFLRGPLDLIHKIKDAISRRAHDLFLRRGSSDGQDHQDWYDAEQALLHPVHTLLIESDDSFILVAEVPGYGAEDLAIRIEPRSVTIAGQRKAVGQRSGRKVLQGDHCADQLLRILPLSAEVDASQTAVLVRDGILELEIPKASPDLGAPNEIHSYSIVLAEDYNRWTYALVQLLDGRL